MIHPRYTRDLEAEFPAVKVAAARDARWGAFPGNRTAEPVLVSPAPPDLTRMD